MSVPIHRDPVAYTTNDEVEFLNRLFNQPLPIVAAANRVQAAQERAKEHQWYFGYAWGAAVALVVFSGVWWWCR